MCIRDRYEGDVFGGSLVDGFGDAVVDHYTRFFRTEDAARDTTDSNWDRKRYFERI